MRKGLHLVVDDDPDAVLHELDVVRYDDGPFALMSAIRPPLCLEAACYADGHSRPDSALYPLTERAAGDDGDRHRVVDALSVSGCVRAVALDIEAYEEAFR